MQAGVERKVHGVKHMGQQERVIEDIDDWERRVRGERGSGNQKNSFSITFHEILMELGPVGVATTASGGPDGAASSVRNRIGSDASLQPTSLCA